MRRFPHFVMGRQQLDDRPNSESLKLVTNFDTGTLVKWNQKACHDSHRKQIHRPTFCWYQMESNALSLRQNGTEVAHVQVHHIISHGLLHIWTISWGLVGGASDLVCMQSSTLHHSMPKNVKQIKQHSSPTLEEVTYDVMMCFGTVRFLLTADSP